MKGNISNFPHNNMHHKSSDLLLVDLLSKYALYCMLPSE